MSKAAFLDRDGVINQKAPIEGEYIVRWEDLKILSGVAEAIIQLRRAGFQVIVVTNQRCVAKGLLTESELDSMHRKLREELGALGATIDAIYHCPHDEEPSCSCRKPQAGMLFAAAAECKLDLPSSWIIGDSDKDTEAGKRAGCRTARILESGVVENVAADIRAESLLEAAHKILRQEEALTDSPPSIASPCARSQRSS